MRLSDYCQKEVMNYLDSEEHQKQQITTMTDMYKNSPYNSYKGDVYVISQRLVQKRAERTRNASTKPPVKAA